MSDLPFLSRVGERERSPVRWLVGLTLAVVFTVLGAAALGALLGLLDVQAVVAEIETGPLPDGPRRLIGETQFTFVLAATLALLAVAILAAARMAFHRPGWTFVTPATPFRGRLLLAGFALFGAIAVGGLFVERALRGEPLHPPLLNAAYALDARLTYAAGSALFLLLAAVAEEIVFRGVLLQFTGAFVRKAAVLVAVNGLVFAAFHLDPSPTAFASRTVSGAVWAWTALRLSGIEFAIGAHLANNLTIALLIEPISEGAQEGRDYPFGALAGDVLTTAVLVVCLLLALRSPRLRAWAEVDPPRPVNAVVD